MNPEQIVISCAGIYPLTNAYFTHSPHTEKLIGAVRETRTAVKGVTDLTSRLPEALLFSAISPLLCLLMKHAQRVMKEIPT